MLGLLAGGVSTFALMMPLAGGEASARDYQVTGARSGDNFNVTFRRIPMRHYGIKSLGDGGAPGNNCAVSAFEVVNPRPGEPRCVGYVLPW